MELKALWHILRRRWWLIALPTLAALAVTLPALRQTFAPPVSYQVQMRLTAAAPPQAEADGVGTPYEDTVYVPLLASEYVVVNMPHWITGDRFADEVSDVLEAHGVQIAAEDLRGHFAADSYRSILTLYVTWDEPETLRTIAEAAVTVLQERNQAYFPQFAAEAVRVVPLDEPEVSTLAAPISVRLMPLLRIALGLAAGVGLAALAEYLDDRVRSRADVAALGLDVLAEIPPERR